METSIRCLLVISLRHQFCLTLSTVFDYSYFAISLFLFFFYSFLPFSWFVRNYELVSQLQHHSIGSFACKVCTLRKPYCSIIFPWVCSICAFLYIFNAVWYISDVYSRLSICNFAEIRVLPCYFNFMALYSVSIANWDVTKDYKKILVIIVFHNSLMLRFYDIHNFMCTNLVHVFN